LKRFPARPDPDSELIRRAQEGDRVSLKALLEAVDPTVRQWAMAHTGDADAAADLTQEVLLLLLQKISSYRGDARFLTWLFSVTRNQALEGIRRTTRHERKMERFKVAFQDAPQPGHAHGERVDRDRLRIILDTFLQELPRRQREVFQLSELQGLSSPEISAVLGVEAVSVRTALLKARRSLRRKMLEGHPEFVEEYLS